LLIESFNQFIHLFTTLYTKMMADSKELFTKPLSITGILQNVIFIFTKQWKVFVTISLFQLLSMLGLSFVWLLILVGIVSNAIDLENLQNMQNHLVWSSNSIIGSSSSTLLHFFSASSIVDRTTRLLDEQIDDDVMAYINDMDKNDLMELGFEVLLLFIFFVIMTTLVSSIFKGALLRSAAITYAGHAPWTSDCIHAGREKCCSFFGFTLLLGFVNFGIFLVVVGLPTVLSGDNNMVVIPFLLLFLVVDICFASLMLSGGPAIIVEGTSMIGAIKRSWYLCKGCIGTIIAVYCIYFILDFGLGIFLEELSKMFGNGFLGFVYALLKSLIYVAMSSFGSIMVVVLYMSSRIELEGCTQQRLIEDLKLAMATPLVELSQQPTTNTPTTSVTKNNDTPNNSAVTMAQIV